jgi:hypothetical protein
MKNKPYYKEFNAHALLRVRSSWEDIEVTPDEAGIDAMRQDYVRSSYLLENVAQERATYFANQEMFDIIDSLEL